MAVQLTYTGTPFADQIRQQGFRPGGILSVAPGKIFSTTNPAFASTYGTPINLATSTRAFSLPSFNFTSGVSGREVIQSPEAATKGMRVAQTAERLKNVSPTAAKLLSGKTVSGLGGGVAAPGILRSLFSLPMAAVTAGPQVISSLMAPKTEAGFDYMKNFDKGAITGVFDETAGLDDFEDFGKGIMAADAAAIQRATSIDPNVVAAIDAQTADEQAQLPIDPVDNRNIFSRIKDFVAPTVKDITGRTIASQTLGKAGAMIDPYLGLAGLIFGGLKGGDLFNAPYIEGVTTFDPITGQLISGEELDKLNAAGGYYSDVARAARRRDARIANMRERQALGKRISEDNLARLEAQQAKEEAARQAEFNRIMASEQSQKDFYDSLNEGRGATSTAESRATAGDAPGYSGPSTFAKGGIVGLL